MLNGVSSPWPTLFNYPYRLTHKILSCAVVCYKWSFVPFVKLRALCLSSWLMIKYQAASFPTSWDRNLTRQITVKMTSWYSIRNPHELLSYKKKNFFNYTLKPNFRIRASHTSRKIGGWGRVISGHLEEQAAS